MNRTYNIVWNAARNMYVVASELSRGDSRMKTLVRSVAAMVLLALSPLSAQAESTSEVTNAMVTGETVDASDRQHSYSSGMAISAYSGSPLDKGASLKAQVDNVLELESGNAYILNGESQSFDSVSVGVGSMLDLDGGELTIGHGSRYRWVSFFEGIVTGSGLLNLYSELNIRSTSDLSGLSATINIEQGAQVISETTNLGRGDIVVDGLLSIFSPAGGDLSNSLSGSGEVSTVWDLTVSGDNDSFNGTWIIGANKDMDADLAVADASALGAGNIINGGTLTLGGAEDWMLNSGNVISDYDKYDDDMLVGSYVGKVVKEDANTITVAHANTYSGGTDIEAGTLNADHTGALGTGDVANYATLNLNAAGQYTLTNITTFDGGTTSLAAGATLATGMLDQQDGSVLSINLGTDASSPIITAHDASLGGTLNITGIGNINNPLTHDPYAFTLIDADNAINGDFDTLTVAGMEARKVDFLTVDSHVNSADDTQYELTTSLSWYADEKLAATDAHGTFTLSDPNENFTLNTELVDVNPNSVTGWDGKTLTKAGDGTLTLNVANTWSGDTRVNDGTLWLTDSGVIGASGSTQAVNVAEGATFGGSGVVNGDVYNSGNIAMSHGGETGNTLTINGNYHGDNGSQININSQLGDDSSPTDKLVISGDTSGNTMVYVANVNGKGAQTKNGIEVIDVGGQSSGTFEQGNRVQIGLYEYRLYEDGGDWYLRSQSSVPPEPDDGDCSGTDDTPVTPQYRPDIGAYLGNQWMVRNLQMQTLYDREGSQYHNEDGSVWMRFKAGNAASQAADGNVDINNNYSQIQLGGDILTWGNGVQSLKAGGMASYVNADTDSTSNRGADGSQFSASGNVGGYNLGIYATWFADAQHHRGLYVDSWYQYGFYNNSVQNGSEGSESYDSTAQAASLEGGYRYDIALENQHTLSLTPQAQVVWQRYSADSVTDNNGTRISGQDSDNWNTRLGLRVDGKLHKNKTSIIQPFAEVNWLYTSGDVAVSFDDAETKQGIPSNRVQAKVGIQVNLDSQWSITGQVVGETGSHNYNDLNGSLNLRYSW
ncbi:autotransporter adhesin glycoprotein EhaJ [Escherichia coli]|nr:autotransporter adhesin glycoprotein EhaJ [Escherichia coli]MDY8957562.1 autotransporter adhesin glycoprotein EhaJ [Escherichia coli]MDY9000037.1 autotransporter adhesin glycoprotein EhaJ [Escherichia coli]MDY9032630.1 autotransporter adhesin glycoprotein EhaJ [Escherichia coli]